MKCFKELMAIANNKIIISIYSHENFMTDQNIILSINLSKCGKDSSFFINLRSYTFLRTEWFFGFTLAYTD